jgi:hypothetical protein
MLVKARFAPHAHGGVGMAPCAEHVRQLGGASPLHNLMEVKC